MWAIFLLPGAGAQSQWEVLRAAAAEPRAGGHSNLGGTERGTHVGHSSAGSYCQTESDTESTKKPPLCDSIVSQSDSDSHITLRPLPLLVFLTEMAGLSNHHNTETP